MISKYIIPFYFFIALFIGLFVAYVSTPVPHVIIKYPTPENAGKIIYRDDADVCYKYKATEVSCPKDKGKIKNIGEQTANIDVLNTPKDHEDTENTLSSKIVNNTQEMYNNLKKKYL